MIQYGWSETISVNVLAVVNAGRGSKKNHSLVALLKLQTRSKLSPLVTSSNAMLTPGLVVNAVVKDIAEASVTLKLETTLTPPAVVKIAREPTGKSGMIMVELNSPNELVLGPGRGITETPSALIADTGTNPGKPVPEMAATDPAGPESGDNVIIAPGMPWVAELV